MFTDTEYVIHAHEWYNGEQGTFALACALRLTQHMLSPWARRGHTVLDMGCSHPQILQCFWESGLDVSAITPSLAHEEILKQHLNGKVAVHMGNLEQLPFDDKSFDYVTLMALPRCTLSTLHCIYNEAVRLSSKGVLFQFWNSFSFNGLQKYWRQASLAPFLQQDLWCSWRDARALIRNLVYGLSPVNTLHTGSTLLAPYCTWKKTSWWRTCNEVIWSLPVGAVVQLRLSNATARPLTGIPLDFSSLLTKRVRPATVVEQAGSIHGNTD